LSILQKKRIFMIDPAKHEYTDLDLYANIFFRQAESQNRKMLNGITAQAGIKQIFDPFDTEMLFSLVIPGAAHKNNSVETEQVDGKINYVHKGKTVASYEPSKSALLQSEKRGFTRYLAYNCSLHPEIRGSIASQKMLPEKLMFQFQDGPMAKTDCTYALKSTEEVKVENTSPPTHYKRVQDKELSEIYAALAKYGADPKPPAQSDVSAAVDVDLKNNNPLNAMLTVVEYSLSSGDQRPQDIARVVAKSNGNSDFQLFFKNLEPHSAAEAKTAVKALESINRTKLSKGYVIDIMEANIYMQLRDLPKAKMLFKRALVANPLNVSALHDLGNLFIAMWAPHTAWECFRIARKIDPTHPIMKDIDELEHKLQKDFPDYF
jgi:tetratricopeptide (TPR) repeat protein